MSGVGTWNVLLPVLVGGAIGIVGSFVGPYFLQRLKDAAENKRKRAEKFEELVGAVYEHAHWMDTWRNFTGFGQGSEPTLSPITRIEGIVSTYFPEFEGFVRQFDMLSTEYEMWILDTAKKRVQNEPGYEALIGHKDILKKYIAKRDEFVAELRSFARREFQ